MRSDVNENLCFSFKISALLLADDGSWVPVACQTNRLEMFLPHTDFVNN